MDANANSPKNITVGGDWMNRVGAGGFLARSGKVDLDRDPAERAIGGSTTFYDLELSSESAQTVYFQSGQTQTVTHDLTLSGAAGNPLTLEPSLAAADWYLAAPSSYAVQYVRVSHSDATSGVFLDVRNGANSDGGNNQNWNLEHDAPLVEDQTLAVAENAASGALVGAVVAHDLDPGDVLVFAITGGNLQDVFQIDPASGEIHVADGAVLDYETTNRFQLTVEVTDASLLTDTATITVELSKLDDSWSSWLAGLGFGVPTKLGQRADEGLPAATHSGAGSYESGRDEPGELSKWWWREVPGSGHAGDCGQIFHHRQLVDDAQDPGSTAYGADWPGPAADGTVPWPDLPVWLKLRRVGLSVDGENALAGQARTTQVGRGPAEGSATGKAGVRDLLTEVAHEQMPAADDEGSAQADGRRTLFHLGVCTAVAAAAALAVRSVVRAVRRASS